MTEFPRHRASRPASGQPLREAIALHRAGRLDAAKLAYTALLAADPRQPDAWHLLALVLRAKGELSAALDAVDRALPLSPETAAFHVSRAAILLALDRIGEAGNAIERALMLDPCHAEAHTVLGTVQLHQGDAAAAALSFERATALRADYPEAWNNLGSALRTLGRLDAAARALEKALELRPAYASALTNLGLVRHDQARYAEALSAHQRAVACDPSDATARANRAVVLLLLGRYRDGWADYEARWQVPGFTSRPRRFAAPTWSGEPLAGRRILLHAEQGLGSAIQFVRFAIDVAGRGARVLVEAPRPLVRLFAHSLTRSPDPIAEAVIARGEPLPEVDLQLPLMSLPHRLGIAADALADAVPYLHADPELVAEWEPRLDALPRPRIGLVWAGNPEHRNDHNRSLPAEALIPLLDGAPQVSFVTLQVGPAASAVAALPEGRVFDPTGEIRHFADTAAILTHLDLVISVDTAVAHLAGALGRPCWLLLPFVPEWRWLLDRGDTPWYPTLRLFRQKAPGDWAGVVAELGRALAERSRSIVP